MLNDYLRQKVILKTKTGTNIYNEAIYEEKEILCRIVEKFKEVSNDKGDKVVSSAIVQCIEAIKVGDCIGDKQVIAVNTMTSLEGIIGYKGYLL